MEVPKDHPLESRTGKSHLPLGLAVLPQAERRENTGNPASTMKLATVGQFESRLIYFDVYVGGFWNIPCDIFVSCPGDDSIDQPV